MNSTPHNFLEKVQWSRGVHCRRIRIWSYEPLRKKSSKEKAPRSNQESSKVPLWSELRATQEESKQSEGPQEYSRKQWSPPLIGAASYSGRKQAKQRPPKEWRKQWSFMLLESKSSDVYPHATQVQTSNTKKARKPGLPAIFAQIWHFMRRYKHCPSVLLPSPAK